MINGLGIMDLKCNNKHIHNTFYEKRKISPRRKAFWDNIFMDTDWEKAWILLISIVFPIKLKKFTSKFYTLFNKSIFL